MSIASSETQKLLAPTALGIMGGTFDPIHYGHINSAKQTAQWLGLDELLLLPAHIPPHKESTCANAQHRVAMVQLVCENSPLFKLDSRELTRASKSYTVDTLTEIKKQYPHCTLFFIIGMDSFLSFTQWHQWQTILSLCHLVVNKRPGYELSNLNPQTKQLLSAHQDDNLSQARSKQAGCILFCETNLVDASSTGIRQRLHNDQSCIEFLPVNVLEYIEKQQLYR